ncbi:MAG: NADH-quinone oxidoreductase subunit N [Desulfurellaceae bacterium]|nr:NADH-quinone oxidoreductase subunit N [Desulfurellaceae bacterium]
MTPIPPPDINWLSVVPSGLLVLTAILVLFWDLWIQEEDRPHLVWLTISGFVVTGVVSFGLWGQADASGPLALDSYALFFNGIFCLAGVLTVLMSGSYLDLTKIRQGEYYALLLFAAVGMVLMAAATDLITIFLGLETMSIAVYVLAGIWHQRLASNEAALKYFLLGAFASGFLLYGMALIYGVTGSLQLAVIAEQVAAQGSSTLLLVGMGLLLVGFGFKVAAAPFHVWTPDVYEGSPTTITAFMAVGVKAAAFAAFARVFLYALAAVHAEWQGVVWVIAVLTMTVGNLTALVQTNIKRMLAYSSVAHAGYVLVAMVAGKELGGAAMMYYLVAYGFMNLGAFGVVLSLNRQDQPNEELRDYPWAWPWRFSCCR